MKVTCPLCKKEFVTEGELEELKTNIECPYCNTDFVASRESKE